ncbi:MAG: nicotinate-nucleotide--dimethylbenzimidazole phosphoribosyltransferase [bacterium LCO1.1]|uniref:Nicotinate-nucleotide--dimethylbenzimidazole phosphoribosyltransferase n=1 Tax=Candidatus Weimeria bifida TaxID=2599074 RepID=A0A6N7IX05_9FIRM|nr:nicotinate-nucleotide--dimethylbenzimidazole phosphoribosyltransferase [Candidatus Weimeria bifida]
MPFLDRDAMDESKKKWDSVAHPLHGLGTMEDIIVQIAGITGSADIDLTKKNILIFCGDNGISETAVSQSGSAVTAMVADEIAENKSSVNRMAAVAGAEVSCIDVGIKDETHSGNIIQKNIVRGTKNFLESPAMEADQARSCIKAGEEALKESGADIAAVGEMGIGDTTCAAVITASLLNLSAEDVTGRGAGLSDDGLLFKRKVISQNIRYGEDPLKLLARIGGTEIGAMAGAFISGAENRIPVVADGAVSLSAALLAEKLVPGTKNFIIASIAGREPVTKAVSDALGLDPVIYANLSLGEGTGAVMLFPLLDEALAVYNSAHSFKGMKLEPYKAFGKEQK